MYSISQVTEKIANELGFEFNISASGSNYVEKNGFTLLRVSNHENGVMFRNQLNAIVTYNSSDDNFELELGAKTWKNVQLNHIYNVLLKLSKKELQSKSYLFN